ncbi:hypothetical protein [Armatimonas rosea]|uniref:Uncharacterized protein n=1 Tax=Armatimonas rosea TaxID=685828 RepID=A0A7W9SNV7_ARMRO|nr:hypothetical protein [Armatimonas rosea]MBB6049448.1 hypothetical protein [Armatimonas rosea]
MPYRQPLQILSVHHKLVRSPSGLPLKLSLKVRLNQEAKLDAQLKTVVGRSLMTLSRPVPPVQVAPPAPPLTKTDSRPQEIELEGELKDAEGQQLRPGGYLLEITATTDGDQKVTRRLPLTLIR